MTDDDIRKLRELAERVDAARNFPSNTCPASRHVALIADMLAERLPHATEDPEHCAESLYVTVEALWKARTEIDALRRERDHYRDALKANEEAALDRHGANVKAWALLREARAGLDDHWRTLPEGAAIVARIDALLGDGHDSPGGVVRP